MDTTKLRARLGTLELEFEGDQAFLETKFPILIGKIVEAVSEIPEAISAQSPAGLGGGPAAQSGGGAPDHSTNTIATLTDAKTGPELALAAAAHLALVKGRDRFTRKELLAEMQGATTYYNQNYSGNLTKILDSLVKGKRLNLVGTATYALTKQERDSFEAKLAQPA